MVTGYADWPVWLTARSFAGWFKAENRLREMAGDEPMPEIPDDVLRYVGLTRVRRQEVAA